MKGVIWFKKKEVEKYVHYLKIFANKLIVFGGIKMLMTVL